MEVVGNGSWSGTAEPTAGRARADRDGHGQRGPELTESRPWRPCPSPSMSGEGVRRVLVRGSGVQGENEWSPGEGAAVFGF